MKKQITKYSYFFNAIIILCFLVFPISCQKRIIQYPGKTIVFTGSNIIYTSINPDSVILKSTTDSFDLDLNKDGTNDFIFHRSYTVTCRNTRAGTSGTAIHLFVTPASSSNSIMTNGSNLALALDSSAAIVPNSVWGTTDQTLLYGSLRGCVVTPAYGGYWLNVSDKYVGLKFTINNITHYGWARFSSSYSVSSTASGYLIVGQLILKDYAYNIIPNQFLLAGQTK
ncbi:MAG TPA: hypothetical protein VKR53_18850 [Puia sp.]|nr:hypothetical protein [Puia sp.]